MSLNIGVPLRKPKKGDIILINETEGGKRIYRIVELLNLE